MKIRILTVEIAMVVCVGIGVFLLVNSASAALNPTQMPETATPLPQVTLPPMIHDERMFERPARPIMPTATPMTQSTRITQQPTPIPPYPAPPQPTIMPTTTQLFGNQGNNTTTLLLNNKIYLPIVMKNDYSKSLTVFSVAYLDKPGYTANDIYYHQNQLINDLQVAATWHNLVGSVPPSLSYSISQVYPTTILSETPPHRSDNGFFDYDAVYSRFNLCAKIQAGEINEVWIWESGDGNGAEFVVNGSTWNAIPVGFDVPNCGSTVATFNFRFDLDEGYPLHTYGHRVEDAFLRYNVSGSSTCDFITASGPAPAHYSGNINDPNCSGSKQPSDFLGFIARPMSSNYFVPVCGDVHFPPNIFPPWSPSNEYQYNSSTYVDSRCPNWQWDINGPEYYINSNIWSGSQRGYLIWWMQQIPGNENTTSSRTGAPQPNWWQYLWK